MFCEDCHVALVGFSKKYCPRCQRIYVPTSGPDGERIYVRSNQVNAQHPTHLVLQSGPDQNPGFLPQTSWPPERRQRDRSPEPTMRNQGGRTPFTRPPLLHLVWFGQVESIEKFAPAFLWAQCLGDWAGVCLWVDETCFSRLASFSRFGSLQRVQGIVETQLPSQPLRSLGRLEGKDQVPVHFISNDFYLGEMARRSDAMARLVEAINHEKQHEPPWRLAQVASDIMRILVLIRAGGAYFDFDVSPAVRGSVAKFPGRSHIDMSTGIFGHPKPSISENDIIFADPNNQFCLQSLEGVVTSMASFYGTADARTRRLRADLENSFSENLGKFLDAYHQSQRLDGDLLQGVAKLVAVALASGSKDHYLRALSDEMKLFVRLVSDSIEMSTFGPFAGHVPRCPDPVWDELQHFFSYETRTKVFYSWKDPGVVSCMEYLEQQGTILPSSSLFSPFVSRRYEIVGPVPMYQSSHCGSHNVRYEVLSGEATTTRNMQGRYVQVNVTNGQVRSIASGFPTRTDHHSSLMAFVHETILGSAVMPAR